VETTSARLNEASTTFRSGCKRRSRVRVARMARRRKKISIALDNWPTISTRCVDVWTKELRAATGSSKVKKVNKVNETNNRRRANHKVSSKVSNKDNSKDSSKANEASRDNLVNKARSRASRPAANRRAAARTVVIHKRAEIAAASIVRERSAATGATTANCPQKFVNGYAKRRICDASGEQLAWAPSVSTKSSRNSVNSR